jgi:hypothetical protein
LKPGSHHTAEAREKIGAGNRGKTRDLVFRAEISARTQAAMAAPEVRQRVSERTKAALADPDVNARQRAGLKAAFADPALRLKVSIATKAGIERKRVRDLQALRDAWRRADKATRSAFSTEIGRG